MTKKCILAGALAVLICAFFVFGGPEALSLDALKAGRGRLTALYQADPLPVLAAYAVVYTLAAALSLPGATVLTLAGSAVFGFWTGLVVVSFASTLGATLACMLSRYLLRDAARNRLGALIGRIDRGLAGQGAWYLASLRLVPVVPFFLVNLAMGLTTMRLGVFWWVSQLAMLPGTMVYVNAGVRLGSLQRLSDAASPGVVASLVLLAAFPLVAKWLLARFGRAPGGS